MPEDGKANKKTRFSHLLSDEVLVVFSVNLKSRSCIGWLGWSVGGSSMVHRLFIGIAMVIVIIVLAVASVGIVPLQLKKNIIFAQTNFNLLLSP